MFVYLFVFSMHTGSSKSLHGDLDTLLCIFAKWQASLNTVRLTSVSIFTGLHWFYIWLVDQGFRTSGVQFKFNKSKKEQFFPKFCSFLIFTIKNLN